MAKKRSKKQIKKEFQEEIKRPLIDNKSLFYSAIKKDPEDLTKEEEGAIIYRMAQLSDDERYKFRKLLVLENLTQEQEQRFHRLFHDKAFDKYFPKKENVEEHYKNNFTNRR